MRYLADGSSVQRWLCRLCGYRFSEPDVEVNVFAKVSKRSNPVHDLPHDVVADSSFPFKESVDDLPFFSGENVASHGCTVTGQELNSFRDYNSTHQVCVRQKAKNLETAVEQKATAGEATTTQTGTILEYAWKLKKRGLAEITISHRTRLLEQLLRKGAILDNPDTVETLLATEELTSAKKSLLVAAYRSFTKTMGISWTPIRAKYQPKQPFVPLESELDQLIAACGKKTATFLQVLKDTGARSGEVCKLKWTDIDDKTSAVRINNPEKNSNARTVKVSAKTIAMINAMPKKHEEYIFNPRLLSIECAFRSQRNRLAVTLQNPRLKQIHLHTFRHWKATTEYARTKDILYVMRLLGHKNIQNTLMYTHLISFESDEYHSATASTVDQAKQLIEAGFEYVCDMQDIKLFKKRK
jgi:integrase